uniref:Exostosin GT47 domain-containing protein n=1 Tax=viral metagenome TaxID=1070528 RepID=A0A6C0DB11_9ZZZZ
MEDTCTFVSSRGILKSADVHSINPVSSIRHIHDHDWSKIKPGAIIHVCSSATLVFVTQIFPKIPFPIILITGDADQTVPIQVLPADIITKFLNDPRLLAWYTQNLGALRSHSKLRPMPIGLDYHTMAANRNHPWGPQMTPPNQEALLLRILKAAPPLTERKLRIHSNFHFALDNRQFANDRRDALTNLPKELVDYEPTPTDRETTWCHQSQYAFVASPMGGGLDCHRTWEALALGCIPILHSSSIDGLFEGLPVLIVKNWSDVTKELLAATVEGFVAIPPSLDKLKLSWWMNEIRTQAKNSALDK